MECRVIRETRERLASRAKRVTWDLRESVEYQDPLESTVQRDLKDPRDLRDLQARLDPLDRLGRRERSESQDLLDIQEDQA